MPPGLALAPAQPVSFAERRTGPSVAACSERAQAMTDDFELLPEESSTAAKVADCIKTATGAVSDAIKVGREPGMPLYTLIPWQRRRGRRRWPRSLSHSWLA
jgi:hypothetical protein